MEKKLQELEDNRTTEKSYIATLREIAKVIENKKTPLTQSQIVTYSKYKNLDENAIKRPLAWAVKARLLNKYRDPRGYYLPYLDPEPNWKAARRGSTR